jgi:chromosome segregation protein
MERAVVNNIRKRLLGSIYEEKKENDRKTNKIKINSRDLEQIEQKYRDQNENLNSILIETENRNMSSNKLINLIENKEKEDNSDNSEEHIKDTIVKSHQYLKKLSKREDIYKEINNNHNLDSIIDISIYSNLDNSISDTDSISYRSKTNSIRSNSVYTPLSIHSSFNNEELNQPINFEFYFNKFKDQNNGNWIRLHSKKQFKSVKSQFYNEDNVYNVNKNYSGYFSECSIEN